MVFPAFHLLFDEDVLLLSMFKDAGGYPTFISKWSEYPKRYPNSIYIYTYKYKNILKLYMYMN